MERRRRLVFLSSRFCRRRILPHVILRDKRLTSRETNNAYAEENSSLTLTFFLDIFHGESKRERDSGGFANNYISFVAKATLDGSERYSAARNSRINCERGATLVLYLREGYQEKSILSRTRARGAHEAKGARTIRPVPDDVCASATFRARYKSKARHSLAFLAHPVASTTRG